MRVGVLKELKADEYRVALTPAGARELTSRGHTVLVETLAGEGSAFGDEAYVASGAQIAESAEAVFSGAELILKVKEPLEQECLRLHSGHVLFTFLHLAPNAELTRGLVDSGCVSVAYETVGQDSGHLPLLAPMSEVAGRLAPQAAAYFLERMNGGKGKLLAGVTGVAAAKVVILGAGIAGSNAALVASGMRARVTILDVKVERLAEVERMVPGVEALMSNQLTIEEQVERADVVIGAVLVPGARTPQLVSEDLVKAMQAGSVVVDISVDQGGCIATSHMTTHSSPTFVVDEVVHYCVGNMAGAVPITSTLALTNATLPYIMKVAEQGLVAAARSDRALARGINVMEGKVTNSQVAKATGNRYFPLESLLPIEFS
ncbi:MAG TPA: alanine dehydrogenase [Thermoleophilia bacterium]|nr:alanine dehydrogenase [Thermoleophilia bacterium]